MWSNQQYFVTEGDENKRVINSNDAVSAAVDRWKASRDARLVAAQATSDTYQGDENTSDELAITTDEDGFTEGIARFQRETVDYEAMAKEEAKNIIAAAKAEADRIVEQAQREANEQSSAIRASAERQGFDEGMAKAQAKAQEMAGIEQAKLDQEREQMHASYEKKLETMESELIDAIIVVFEQVFNIQFSDKKDILVYLVSNTLKNIDNAQDFKIRINRESLSKMQENLSVLQEAVGSDVSLEIVTDASLDTNACVIETENGIFDCSMGVQLDNLIRDIKSLSLRTV